MSGFTADFINLIADNLQNRYASGLPILKELIQNADDAQAKSFVFGQQREGFLQAEHPLLQGPGFWAFNNGRFKKEDQYALKSFAINSKAGDATTIGKFGLGMKSVFHLCEAVFYAAWDGKEWYHDVLKPWNSGGGEGDRNPHRDWDTITDSDRKSIDSLGVRLAASGRSSSGFLLWIPLRQKRHLRNPDGKETGSIISRFPGDDLDSNELAFLRDESLAYELGQTLPMLKNLREIEYRADLGSFALRLKTQSRLFPGENIPSTTTNGEIVKIVGETSQSLLRFDGRRQIGSNETFLLIKKSQHWPKSRYRDAIGHAKEAPDKSEPEAAAMLISGLPVAALKTRWAVFLPLEDDESQPHHRLQGSTHGYALMLHGQFFIDSGRKHVHDAQRLHEAVSVSQSEGIDDNGGLRQCWNRQLAQDVLMPLVIPVLEQHVSRMRLSDAETASLTRALQVCELFRKFKGFICRDAAWVRNLTAEGAAWRRVESSDRDRLRPLPTPPKSQPERAWETFPKLHLLDVLTFDGGTDVPCLSSDPHQWPENELVKLLSEIPGAFADAAKMDYFTEFVEMAGGVWPYIETRTIQDVLLRSFRIGFISSNKQQRRQLREKSRRLIGHLLPDRRIELAASLPDEVLHRLWEVDSTILLVPKGMDPDKPATGIPDEGTLSRWLGILQGRAPHATDESDVDPDPDRLKAARALFARLPHDQHESFLQRHDGLRLLTAYDVRRQIRVCLTYRRLQEYENRGILFGHAQGTTEEKRRGLSPLLAAAAPDLPVHLVRSEERRQLAPKGEIPHADDVGACLEALVKNGPASLSSPDRRNELLEKTGTQSPRTPLARKGLRYLLHGNPTTVDADNSLWISRHGQHAAWRKLWGMLHDETEAWRLIDDRMADVMPRGVWSETGIKEIEPDTLIDQLRNENFIPKPETLSQDERDEILAAIDDGKLWKRLSLHTLINGHPATACAPNTYLVDGDVPNALAEIGNLIQRATKPQVREQQEKWLLRLDDSGKLRLALDSSTPHHHWQLMLNCLTDQALQDNELCNRLRDNAWLPLEGGEGAAKPEDVVAAEPEARECFRRLIACHREQHGFCYCEPEKLPGYVRKHLNFANLEKLFSGGRKAYEQLALLLDDLPDYHIGEWQSIPDADCCRLLADATKHPGWMLLDELAQVNVEKEFVEIVAKGLSKPIEQARVVEMLQKLSNSTICWGWRKAAFDEYLRQWSGHPAADRSQLVELSLATVSRQWRNAKTLCADLEGIAGDRLLDTQQAELLHRLIKHNLPRSSGERPPTDADDSGSAQDDTGTTQVLRDYFRDWESKLNGPLIGAFVALLGRNLRELASEYLKPHSFEWLSEQLSSFWKDPGRDSDGRVRWMGERTCREALDSVTTSTALVSAQEIEVNNLIGERLIVPLASPDDAQILLVGGLGGQNHHLHIRLRVMQLESLPENRLRRLLLATAEHVYQHMYNQSQARLDELWGKLGQCDQLEIDIARRLILYDAPIYLRQLGISDNALKDGLNLWDSVRRRKAEKQEVGSDEQNAMEHLADLISDNRQTQDSILHSIRQKIENFEYSPDSIPFELFQNADDALVEQEEIDRYWHPFSDEKDPRRGRFVLEWDDANTLRLLHWGRRINDRGPAGFGDSEERGYDRDLEKMLILNYSDKEPGGTVTGKFGLGFKSVYLACDRPRLISGRLEFDIVAGTLPEQVDARRARQRLEYHSDNDREPARQGTLIELACKSDANTIIQRFRALAGIQTVFARRIRKIEFVQLVQAPSTRVAEWHAEAIASAVEFGQLRLDDPKASRYRALCVRADDGGAALFSLNPDGFSPLPDSVPALWVTAPTRENVKVGFTINADFRIDAGRGRLSDGEENRSIAENLGKSVGRSLATLLVQCGTDWTHWKKKLDLIPEASRYSLLHSLWELLDKPAQFSNTDVGHALCKAFARGVLISLCRAEEALIPSDLPEAYRDILDADDARYQLDNRLATEDLVALLKSWDRFKEGYPPGRLVSERIAKLLDAIGGGKRGDQKRPVVSLSALLALITSRQPTVDDAAVLGKIRNDTDDWDKWDDNELAKRLCEFEFRTAGNRWASPNQLLTCVNDKEENLLHAIAPPDRRLHSDYESLQDGDEKVRDTPPAVEFFMHCRGERKTGIDEIQKWVVDADTIERKVAALQYLVEGESRDDVADKTRNQDWLPTALGNTGLITEAEKKGINIPRLKRQLQPLETLTDNPKDDPAAASILHYPIEIGVALQRIAKWWKSEGASRRANYERELYPSGKRVDLQRRDDGSFDRRSWLTLFALGTFQSMGRTQNVQHKGFINHCQQKGWWDIFAEANPKDRPDLWMNIIEQHADEQLDQETWKQWLGQFLTFYRLSRWMDDYVALFCGLDARTAPFDLVSVLSPRADPFQQGGGIDPPPLSGTLKIGAHFIIRELLRHGVLTSPSMQVHAYAPIERIRDLFHQVGETIYSSKDIHDLLCEHLGQEDAIFGGDYDIPLRILALDDELKERLFRHG